MMPWEREVYLTLLMEHIKENFWTYRFEMWYAEQLRKNPNLSEYRFAIYSHHIQ